MRFGDFFLLGRELSFHSLEGVSFDAQMLFVKPTLSHFCSVAQAFDVVFTAMFSSRSVVVFAPAFRSLMHVHFVCACKEKVRFHPQASV